MSNKANIITKIKSYLSLNPSKTTWAQHEEILYDSTDSILESVYSDVITDSDSLELITTKNTDFEYNIRVRKVAGNITLEGSGTVLTNNPFTLFQISDTNYQGTGRCTGTDSDGNAIALGMKPTGFQTNDTLLAGQLISFSITYNSAN